MRMFDAFTCALGLAAATCMSGALAQGDRFPVRPITIIVPYPAGGVGDLVARTVGDRVSRRLGQPVVVDARPGGNSNIGTMAVLRAPADGYTWLLSTPALMANPMLYKQGVWTHSAFIGVGVVASAPAAVVVPAEIPAHSLDEFVKLAREMPDKYNYGNPGVGSSMHINTEMLKQAAGLNLTSVVYKGQPPALLGLLRNEVSVMLPSVGLVSQYIAAGKLRPLAVIASQRVAALPNVPTLTEAGYPAANVAPWYGLAIAAATPPAIARAVHEAVNAALQAPEVQAQLRSAGMVPEPPRSLAEIARVVQSDTERIAETVRKGNLRAE